MVCSESVSEMPALSMAANWREKIIRSACLTLLAKTASKAAATRLGVFASAAPAAVSSATEVTTKFSARRRLIASWRVAAARTPETVFPDSSTAANVKVGMVV